MKIDQDYVGVTRREWTRAEVDRIRAYWAARVVATKMLWEASTPEVVKDWAMYNLARILVSKIAQKESLVTEIEDFTFTEHERPENSSTEIRAHWAPATRLCVVEHPDSKLRSLTHVHGAPAASHTVIHGLFDDGDPFNAVRLMAVEYRVDGWSPLERAWIYRATPDQTTLPSSNNQAEDTRFSAQPPERDQP